jgi:hypothetical protein
LDSAVSNEEQVGNVSDVLKYVVAAMLAPQGKERWKWFEAEQRGER